MRIEQTASGAWAIVRGRGNDDARTKLTVEDVEHIRFRPMSPTEARGHGLDWGVFQTDTGGYPVTAVKL